MNKDDFIELEIKPTLGDFVDDYDVEGIYDEVAEYVPLRGIVWKDKYACDYDAYEDVLFRHDMTRLR